MRKGAQVTAMEDTLLRERLVKRIAFAIAHRRSGHLCASLSVLDVLIATFLHNPALESLRTANVILSKGHAAPALYAVLAERGDLRDDALRQLRRLGSPLQGHPTRGALPAVEVTTGSLGNGVAFAVGFALGQQYRRAGGLRNTICIASDGELQTGIALEALAVASHRRPPGLVLIVDCNGWQTDGPLSDVHGHNSLDILRAFGLPIHSVDGHDVPAIHAALAASLRHSPSCILARTVRCKGLEWVSRGPEVYGEAISDKLRAELLRWSEVSGHNGGR